MIDKIYTTLKAIRAHRPCGIGRGSGEGYDKLRKFLGRGYGDNTPVTFRQIYESNRYDDTFWCLRCVDPVWDGLIRHIVVDCAEDVRHMMTDQRSIDALDVSRRYADGLATDDELKAARDAAGAAAWASARDAAGASARAAAGAAAWAAWDAAGDAAWASAGAAARAAAWDAARATAWDAAGAAAWDAAGAAARKKQIERLFIYCKKGARP